MSLPSPPPSSTVAVTGASAGIGAELARELARRGHNLALVARDEARLEDLASELRASDGVEVETFAADLTQDGPREELVRALEEGSREVVGLCNNAGVGSFGRFQELPFEGEASQVQLNVVALHELTGRLLPGMIARGRGAILNVGSIAGFQPQPIQSTYSATKAFVNAFSEALHEDLRGTGVSCTVITPGPVDTEFGERAGVPGLWGGGPDALWGTPEQQARVAIEGMVHGRRSVLPGLLPKVAMVSGRATPRSLSLPAFRLLGSRLVERA
jgi:short-subunit dehydrogenase